jgi:hypothetical protein
MLSGGQEVPPVTSSGSGSGTISIGDDKTVTGSVTTTGVTGTMAHIHNGATGKNGPVVVPLSKNGENTWAVPSGMKLTDAQYVAFKAGDLYVNVHSAQHQGGEVRGQLKTVMRLPCEMSYAGHRARRRFDHFRAPSAHMIPRTFLHSACNSHRRSSPPQCRAAHTPPPFP